MALDDRIIGNAFGDDAKQRQDFLHDKNALHEVLLGAIAKLGVQVMVVERGRIVHTGNHQIAKEFGFTEEEILAGETPLASIIHPDDRARVLDYHRRRLGGEPGVPFSYECALVTKDGERREYEVAIAPVAGSVPARFVTVGKDISQRRTCAIELSSRERQYRTLVENSPDMISRFDRECRRLYANPALGRRCGCDPASLVGKKPSEFPGWSHASRLEHYLENVFRSGESAAFEMEWKEGRTDGGHPTWVEGRLTPEFGGDGTVESVLGVFRDVTELHLSRQKLKEMAFYDTLTGLPNRALLKDRLQQAIADAAYHGRKVCVMMIDLDRFKFVNDSLGHAAGDQLLMEVARRLRTTVRTYDTVARLGGDEFVVLMPEVRHRTDLGRIAGKLLHAIRCPHVLGGKEVSVTASIGIAMFPKAEDDGPVDISMPTADMLMYADTAMYKAKHRGRGGFEFYSRELTLVASRNLAIETGLRHALRRGEFELHFQPKVSLASGQIIGSEALLRWRSPQLGQVPPDHFIPIAEDTGSIIEIGLWVFHEACRAALEWNGGGMPPHKVAVNVSVRQLHAQDFVERVVDVLKETCCRPDWIELEVTESIFLDKHVAASEVLSRLRSLGFSIAIDDFGTGYSSLTYLSNFEIDTLKIDKSFVHTLTSDQRRADIVKAIISMAECLGQKVVVEGVETHDQAAFLKDLKCDFAQGWHYGHPVPKDELTRLLAANVP